MEPGQSGSFQAGREYLIQKSIVPGVKDPFLVMLGGPTPNGVCPCWPLFASGDACH